MELAPGAAVGPYVIADRLGAGGMGVVYRARDTRLERDVAIKVLPESVAFDAERRSRLQREARLLASINHPHIAVVHGLEDAGGRLALVLELVEGPTLADRLDRGPIPTPEATAIAAQLVQALDAAHERGVIHRDLKPANIKLAPHRGAKVLDFGLAKTRSNEEIDQSQLPTMTSDDTELGTVLGTAAYMSPEQARGLAVDKRTDIWAFGCVLYEMLTGRRPFPGATPSDAIAAILEREPDWQALPPDTPAEIRRLLRRCLTKDPKLRLRDIGDAASDLAGERTDGRSPDPAAGWRAPIGPGTLAGAALALIAITAVVTWIAGRGTTAPPAAPSAPVVRFSIPPPPGHQFGSAIPDVEATYLALSPDGNQLAFIASNERNVSRVWLRRLSALEATPVAGTEGATTVFWSPDGRALAFFAGDQLKRLDLPDGRPVALAAVPPGVGMSGAWTDAGEILFTSIQGSEITRVHASGGEPAREIAADAPRELRLKWPAILPGGRWLYLAIRDDATGDLKLVEPGQPPRSLTTLNSNAAWVDAGFVVFAREGSLLAQAFDPAQGRFIGQLHAIADRVDYSYIPPRAVFAVSRTGAIAFQPHRDTSRLVRFSRTGAELESFGGQPSYVSMRVAPDGRRILLAAPDARFGTNELWLIDLARGGVETRVTADPRPELPGPWFPGQARIAYSVARGGLPQLMLRDLSTGADRELLPATGFQIGGDFTPDGKQLLFAHRAPGGTWSIMSTTLDANPVPTPVITSPFSTLEPRLSRDGRALAFVSNESGGSEVYVAPFAVSGQKVRVSTGGGRMPRWCADGGELCYVSGDGRLMAVTVRTAPSLDVGSPRTLFTPAKRWSDYDISSADGTIIAIVPQIVAREQPITVVLNWQEEIRK
ncbi:MAG TPA: protein kinase [Vicinamibacterales bacterium]|nr:protein kinase [Vicinamibacterales bacterium]